MTRRYLLFVFLFLGAALALEEGAGSISTASAQTAADAEAYARLTRELNKLLEELPAKREELARLRHRWVVRKGRVPTEKEIEEFEKKLAKGKAKPTDNPYFNKNPLSSPAPARAAYYQQLEEVRRHEERIRQLQEELAALERRR